MVTCAALIVAAGRGQRFGGDQPKQYTDLGGVPVLRHSLAAFSRHPRVESIQPVIHRDDGDLFRQAAEGIDVRHPVGGGETRQASVLCGLEAFSGDEPDVILVHDGARPFPGHGVIDRVLDQLKQGSTGVIPVVPVPDTLKRIDETNIIVDTVPRAGLVRAQTPQGFVFETLLEAHRSCATASLTDDAAVLEECGHPVTTVPGDAANIKVTDQADLETVAVALYETRTGTGFDVHRFGPGTEIILGGVTIPSDRRLEGHSDADVVLHAATDAVLGAMADGDIGVHFPPSDQTYTNAASDLFLRFASERLQSMHGRLVHLDLTVICERPKLSPHREAIRHRIAEILNVPVNRVSVKATTTEGLGFTGRGEGIACQATATVQVVAPLA